MRTKSTRLLFITVIFLIFFNLVSIAHQGTYATNLSNSQTRINSTLTSHEPILISNNGNFSDYSLPGSGTELDPYRIENYNITTINNYGISVLDTTDYFIIQNCYIDARTTGVAIGDVTPGTGEISDVICYKHDFYGIVIIASQITVKNSIVKDNTKNPGLGIMLVDSSEITLTNNTCIDNVWGLYMENTNSCVITHNTFSDNLGYGAYLLSDTNNNILHHNKFINNYDGAVMQARDDGVNNFWYEASSEEGNYWDNWTSQDSVVPIAGLANNEDPYPLDENLTRGDEASLFFLPAIIALIIVAHKKRTKK
ncbi:MAG: NosD domain-containing protein [Candidatus Heimdallarchaeaceae archaeon]